MKGKIFKIKNMEDELVLPITTTEAVYSEDGKTLNDEIDNINSSLDNIKKNTTSLLNIKTFLCEDDKCSGGCKKVKGDGVHDDTSGIIKVFNSLNGENKKIYIPKGTYKITSPIDITLKNNTEIYGDGKDFGGSVFDYQNTSNDYLFKLYGVNNFKMRDFLIKCNGNKGVLFGDKDNSSQTYRSGHTLLEDITIYNTIQGVSFDISSGFNYFERVGIDVADNGVAFSVGKDFKNTGYLPNYIFLNKCNFQNSSKKNTVGIELNCVQYMQISQCDIAGFDYGLKIENTKEVSNIVIDKNYFFQDGTSIYVKTNGGACRNITMRDNNHLFSNGTFMNIQSGTNQVYTFLLDGDFIQGSLANGYILNNVDLTISNLKSHFVKLNNNSTIGSDVNLSYSNMKMKPKKITLNTGASGTVTFEYDKLPITPSGAVVVSDYQKTVKETQNNGILTVTVTNTHSETQDFTVFLP